MTHAFDQLCNEELAVFVALMDLPDPEILALINQSEVCTDSEFESVLAKIRQAQ